MLPKFRVSLDEATMVPGDDLKFVVAAVLQKMGVPRDDAALGADVLVLADLRGVDSHGVSNMLRSYVNGYTSGQINPNPQMTIVRETPGTASIDSDRGLGIITTPKAMDIAIQKAAVVGIGMVTLGNARHLGMASYHAMLALEHDMIGVCMTSCPPSVVPTFGAEPRLGTNPIAIAVPSRHEAPFVFDAATSTVAGNKVGIARRLGVKLEPGWLADSEGTPIMEETDAPDNYTLLTLGSTRELGSHKGYGLSCMVDILAGVLTGFGYGAVPGRPNFGHYVAAYNVAGFDDPEHFKDTMDEWLRMMKNTRPAPGEERVMVAGQPEAEMEIIRRAEGIPLHQEVVDWFHDTCGELGIECPFADLVEHGLINVVTTDLTIDEVTRHHTDVAFGILKPLTNPRLRGVAAKYTEIDLPIFVSESLLEQVKGQISTGVTRMHEILDATILPVDEVKPSLIFGAYDRQEGLFDVKNKRNQFPDAFIFERLKMFASDEKLLVIVADDGDFEAPCKNQAHIDLVESVESLFARLGLLIDEPDPDWEYFLYSDLMGNSEFLSLIESDDWGFDEYTVTTVCEGIEVENISAFKQTNPDAPLLINAEMSAVLTVNCQHQDGGDPEELSGEASVSFYATVQTDDSGDPTEVTDIRPYRCSLSWSGVSIRFIY